MRPIIGVSGNIEIEQNGRFPGYKSAFAYDDYIQAVEMAGGTACVVPVTTRMEVISSQAEHIDGLLLTGGVDINPLFYGEEPEQGLSTISPERDEFDITLFRTVMNLGKPVFAICRGIHVVNVALGGTLFQDLKSEPTTHVKHEQSSEPQAISHTVYFEESSYFHGLFGERALTNSFHHQAIRKLAGGIKAVGHAADGVIEAIQNDDRSIVGVQWHPERLARNHFGMLRLFEDFVERTKGK
ncbi:gamma-glutamyl-gamma-aminobutyrate hydrolase family protein [Aciduricibacillus chroicocephali]|uniref:Gamma-glutamyl-gamma-aminobutyrate hydrolase family protein n=1 Tax=Aciduricibacillus chroicocephali TaxID=3054939 RepID=A0ABY9KV05_9BACI|nr:gamma-glutamyl-gamma-aminobutyrate hydrolase family protein [Bacillaceae bacterium 44XB]